MNCNCSESDSTYPHIPVDKKSFIKSCPICKTTNLILNESTFIRNIFIPDYDGLVMYDNNYAHEVHKCPSCSSEIVHSDLDWLPKKVN